MTKWTDEQKAAINVKGRAAIVSAAAGSGKTTVLVEKLLRLLTDKDDPVPADKIAVVTFTNDAAFQMKSKLMAAISKELENDPDNELLIKQQALLPSAKISTIHTFCFDLIRENAGLTDVDPNFRILEETETEVVAAKAAENVINSRFESGSTDIKELTDFFCPGSAGKDELMKIIPPLRKKLLALPFPETVMDRIVKRHGAPGDIRDDELVKIYVDTAAEKLTDAFALLTEGFKDYNLAYGGKCKRLEKIKEGYKGLLVVYKNSVRAKKALAADPYALLINDPEFKFSTVSVRASDKYTDASGEETEIKLNKDAAEAAKKKLDEAKKVIEKFWGVFTEEDIKGDYIIHRDKCALLFGLIKDILAEEDRLKREMNALSFSDAEQLARALLCDPNDDGTIDKTPLAQALSEHYEIVMIDEFQDSTAVQELIFKMLSRGGTADTPGTNFFAVGDVKQSIYRFRCADPSLFLHNLDSSLDYADDGNTEPCRILLNMNFRSSENVVNFVNAVFNAIMSKEVGGLDYGSADSLVKGAEVLDNNGPTEMIMLPESADFTDDDSEDDGISAVDRCEAEIVTARIASMIGGDINDGGTVRKICPSDFCILMRDSKKADLFVNSLRKLGVSAEGPAEESYLGSREITVLTNLLRCIDNPSLDIPLTSVLMSPMFMFTAEDMALIALRKRTSMYKKITEVCREWEEKEQEAKEQENSPAADDEEKLLAEKCGSFLVIFGMLREYAASHSVEQLINYIYDKTDFMASISVYKDSRRKKANLRLLPIYAAEYDKIGTGGLSGFLRRIDSMIRSGKDFSSASAVVSSTDSVKVKTIHKSKGLEFPFVFLCGSWKKFNETDLNGNMLFTPYGDFGAAFKICDPRKLTKYDTLQRQAVRMVLRRSQWDEEMMLLYVALTRAKNRLFITRRTDSAAVKRREYICSLLDFNAGKQIKAVKEGIRMSDWLDAVLGLFTLEDDGTLILKNSAGEEICRALAVGEVSKETFSPRLTEEDTAESETAAPPDTASAASENAAETEAEDIPETPARPVYNAEIAEIFRKNMTFDYDYALSRAAAKLSVTEIAKRQEKGAHTVFSSKKPGKKPKGISAAAAGTAVHAFMQYADLKALRSAADRDKAITAEAARLCGLGRITDLEAGCVDPAVVSAFLDSKLCERMLSSPEVYPERKFLIKISDIGIDLSKIMLDDSDLSVYNNTDGMIQGIADCVFREGDGFVLVDYKTDRNVTEDILLRRHSLQLTIYAAALSKILGSPVNKKYIYSFDMGQSLEVK